MLSQGLPPGRCRSRLVGLGPAQSSRWERTYDIPSSNQTATRPQSRNVVSFAGQGDQVPWQMETNPGVQQPPKQDAMDELQRRKQQLKEQIQVSSSRMRQRRAEREKPADESAQEGDDPGPSAFPTSSNLNEQETILSGKGDIEAQPVLWTEGGKIDVDAIIDQRQQAKKQVAEQKQQVASSWASYLGRDLVVPPDADLSSMLGRGAASRAQLSGTLLRQVMELPRTRTMVDFQARADQLAMWKQALGKGIYPNAKTMDFPEEPFKSNFMNTLSRIELARFCRRHPKLLNGFLEYMLDMVQEGEGGSDNATPEASGQQEQGEGQDGGQDQPQQPPPQQNTDGKGNSSESGELSPEQQQQMAAQQQELQEQVANIMEEFENQMTQVLEGVNEADQAFGNIDDMLERSQGMDLASGLWRNVGWKELERLRKKLDTMPEIKQLVRQLGRSGGKGPLRRAPQQVYSPGLPPGVIRSALQPEQVMGLTRSGDLSRMLPAEVALMVGERLQAAVDANANGNGSGPSRPSGNGTAVLEKEAGSSSNSSTMGAGAEGQVPGREQDESGGDGSPKMMWGRAAKLLHYARLAERTLMSYERAGWLDGEPSRVTSRMEIRPADEQGPIILCLDTSGSMMGSREVVAKTTAVACIRAAVQQGRNCFLYAFSGPQQVKPLDLSKGTNSLPELLEFLQHSFHGGTDIDKPLLMSLDRIGLEDWRQADILIVTDGDLYYSEDQIQERLDTLVSELGLKVHGLILNSSVPPVMKNLCTDLQLFDVAEH